ncbi:MAG: EVE domain-containing protein [bacterium]
MALWLMKSEPNEYSFPDLVEDPKGWEHWDGVRNYQARNFMRDMKVGDQVFFYHSNCDIPGIYGLAEVCKEAYPDHLAFDPDDKHYDPKSDPENPRWFMVNVKAVRPLKRVISLRELKEYTEQMPDFPLLRRGNRLSVMPVDQASWDFIMQLENQEKGE